MHTAHIISRVEYRDRCNNFLFVYAPMHKQTKKMLCVCATVCFFFFETQQNTNKQDKLSAVCVCVCFF